jgi:filamentous hemagglutinin family protein
MQRKWQRDWERNKGNKLSPVLSKHRLNATKTVTKYLFPPLVAAGIMLSSMGIGYAANLPAGGQVVGGSGTISQNGNTMIINQNSNNLGINWQSFDIGNGYTVNFYQPGKDSIALNRVLGNDASNIYGNLTSNGQVFLVNPNGVLFAKGSQVNVGGIVASTLNISDKNFQAGKYSFTSDGNAGSVVNEGTITAANGGYVALLGHNVANNSVIVAQQGTVALGAGKAVTLNFNGDGLLNLAVDQVAIAASVANHNLIQADGGQVIMTANAANTLAGTVVNNTGIIQARSMDNVNGVIRLDGGTAGIVENSGTLDASGKAAGQTGGIVKVLGETVNLNSGSNIDVSGANKGGTALVGGNFHGTGSEQNATTTTVASDTSINADAITTGNGGKVAVWSNGKTVFNGSISAKGGSQSGDGGSVETSGHQMLKVGDSASVTTKAANGKYGDWLLDPANFTIAASGGDMTGAQVGTALENGNVTILSSQGTVNTSGNGDINVNDAITWDKPSALKLSAYHDLNVNAAITNTGGANIILRADSTGSGSGTVSFTNGSGTGHLFTDGAVNIYYNPASYSDGATQTTRDTSTGMLTGPYGDYVKKADGVTVNNKFMSYMLVNNVTNLQNINNQTSGIYALGKDIDASATRTSNSGQGFLPIGRNNAFQGIFDGDGHTIANLYINSTYIGSVGGSRTRDVGLFSFIGAGGTVRNLGLTNVDITGSNQYENSNWTSDASYSFHDNPIEQRLFCVGGLAGLVESATIDNVYVTGKVTGSNANAVGGLAGLVLESRLGNVDSVINSYSAAMVTASGFNNRIAAGGLIGELDYHNMMTPTDKPGVGSGFVRNSYSSGPVTVINTGLSDIQHSTLYAGGLVGLNQGNSIDQSYSTGTVTVNNSDPKSTVYAGGLVGANTVYLYTVDNGALMLPSLAAGYNWGVISNSYSSGKVSYSGDTTYVGGFVGSNSGAVLPKDNLYNAYLGYLRSIGCDLIPIARNNDNIWSTDFYPKEYLVNFLKSIGVDLNSASIDIDVSTHQIKSVTLAAPVISQSFWNAGTSGLTKGIGTDTGTTTNLTRLTNSQAVAQQSYSGWDFANNWFMIDGYTTPFLRSEYSKTITNGHQLQLMALDPTASYNLAADLDLRDYAMAPTVGFVPINFSGSLDGQGHTLSYLNIHDYGGATVGLFASTGSGSAIHDIALANASISGTTANQSVGILAGVNDGSIYNTYTGGSVSGSGNVGGVAGSNGGTLTASFSSAKVTGGTAGGLVGVNSGTISESYQDDAGSVNGSADGPLAGSNPGLGTITAPTYSGANWVSFGGNRYLAWTVAPDGTIGLYTTSELQAMQNYLSGSYRLRADLDLAGRNWSAIGTAANAAFTGKLDGSGYGIDNLTISGSPSMTAIGLFGYTKGAALSNLTLTNVKVAGGAGNTYVGGLVGNSSGGSITNVAVSGAVTASADGAYYVGGLTGYNSGTIAKSSSAAAVTASGAGSYAGGIVGLNAVGGSITSSSFNTGNVTVNGPNSYAGGLAGQNNGTIALSFNTGAVASRGANNTGGYAGGVAGSNSGTIGSSAGTVYNSGAVITEGDDSYAGGIVGQNTGTIGFKASSNTSTAGTVYNTGKVTAQGVRSSVGGIAGVNAASGKIISAYSAALITAQKATSKVGGLVGLNSGSIQQSYFGAGSSGTVAKVVSIGDGSSVGGIAGVSSGSIADTMNFAVVNSTGSGSKVGGLVGDNSGSLATSYTLGAVQGTVDSSVGGLIGSNSGTVTNAVWNPDSAFAQTDLRWKNAVAVGTGSAAGTTDLTYYQMIPGNAAYWSGWSAFTNWSTVSKGVFPRLKWQPVNMFFGRVTDGGPDVTVNKYDYSYISRNIIPYTTETIGADGLFFMTAGGSQYNNLAASALYPGHTILFTVAGQPYKANSIYLEGIANETVFYDLYKDTLRISVPQITSDMSPYGFGYGLDFHRVFSDDVSSPAVVAAIARNDQDLLFTLSPEKIYNGDWHEPGSVYQDISLYDLNVEGNFIAKNFSWSTNISVVTNGFNGMVSGSVTTHAIRDAKGDITLDNSQLPLLVATNGYPVIGDYDLLFSAGGAEPKYIADGDITINDPGNLAIGSGSGEPRIKAGGDVTINCGGSFINWGGPDAIQAGGRYLIYAKDMLISSWIAPADNYQDSANDLQKYYGASGVAKYLIFGTRYLDVTSTAGLELSYMNDQLIYDTRGGLSGFVQWNTDGASSVPATGSGFIYTAHDPHTAMGIQDRSWWMTPDYLAAQQRQQRAIGTAQAEGVQVGNNSTATSLPATGAVPDVTVVDGGVALPPEAGK